MNLLILAFLCFILKVSTDRRPPRYEGVICLKEVNETDGFSFFLVNEHKQLFRLKYDPEELWSVAEGVNHKGSAVLYPTGFLVDQVVQEFFEPRRRDILFWSAYIREDADHNQVELYFRNTFKTSYDTTPKDGQVVFEGFGWPGYWDSKSVSTPVPARVENTYIFTPTCGQTVITTILSNQPSSGKVEVYTKNSILYRVPFNGSHDSSVYMVPRFVIAKAILGPNLYDYNKSLIIFPDGKWKFGKYSDYKDNYKKDTNTYENVTRYPFVIKGEPTNSTWKDELDSMFNQDCSA